MKCDHYKEFTYGEPPLEPDEDGTLITERRCKKACGYFDPMCDGDTEMCDLPDGLVKPDMPASQMNKAELMQHMARGGYRLHQQNLAPESPRIDEGPTVANPTPETRSATGEQGEGFKGTETNLLSDLILQLVEGMDFDTVMDWADIFKIPHLVDQWHDDNWCETEDELRVAVAEAMGKVGK